MAAEDAENNAHITNFLGVKSYIYIMKYSRTLKISCSSAFIIFSLRTLAMPVIRRKLVRIRISILLQSFSHSLLFEFMTTNKEKALAVLSFIVCLVFGSLCMVVIIFWVLDYLWFCCLWTGYFCSKQNISNQRRNSVHLEMNCSICHEAASSLFHFCCSSISSTVYMAVIYCREKYIDLFVNNYTFGKKYQV